MSDWHQTRLWQQLSAHDSAEEEAVRALLVTWMPKIQGILAQAGTAPTDFTLHDAEHSFRVAEWMAKIIPEDVLEQLCPYELALLLLSAYLHDIGMTPQQGNVDRHWFHLVYGAPVDPHQPRLNEREAADLQAWLDEERPGLTPPLAIDAKADRGTVQVADELMARYCRHRHNDWSEDWTRAHLSSDALPGYERWVDDLVQLCGSHHQSYEDLKQSRFDPRPAGLRAWPIHHRYLACALRVADVLDIDPERTPDVIFRHRAIHPESVLYWRKDHETWLLRDGASLVLAAYPERAVVENAIRATADGIRNELQTCARLNREQPFSYWPIRSSQPLPHRWDFPENLTLHVAPRDGAYDYIEGAFRPNTEKLLELLSGTQLYKEPLAAVRELIQNAFDAVQESMARERLAQPRPNDPSLVAHLSHLHRVRLRLEETDGRTWLTCTDTGVGMTRHIIESYLLVSGVSKRREIVELERQCAAAGFRLNRAAQFGIGVLSYFMIADRIEIRTRRTVPAEVEPTGWLFTTDGVGSFGELRKDFATRGGAQVRLRLRQDFLKERLPVVSRLTAYFNQVLGHLPCHFELTCDGTGGMTLEPGWNPHGESELTEVLLAAFRTLAQPSYTRTMSLRSEREEQEHLVNDMALIEQEIQSCLEWHVDEGELAHDLGRYRVSIPIFSLPGGACAVFLRGSANDSSRFQRVSWYHALEPYFDTRISSLGIVTQLSSGDLRDRDYRGWRFLVEVSFEHPNAGKPSVNRDSFSLTASAQEALKDVFERARSLERAVLARSTSDFRDLNSLFCADLPMMGRPKWLLEDRAGDTFHWTDLPEPATSILGEREGVLWWQSRRVHIIPKVYTWTPQATPLVRDDDGFGVSREIHYEWTNRKPNRFALLPGKPLRLVCLWSGKPSVREAEGVAFCTFPVSWNIVWGLRLEPGLALLNDRLPRSKLLQDLSEWSSSMEPPDEEFLSLRTSAAASKAGAYRFLLSLLLHDKSLLWMRLGENDPQSVREIWKLIFGSRATESKVAWWNQMGNELQLWNLNGCAYISGDDSRIFEVLPDPGDAWRLQSKEKP